MTHLVSRDWIPFLSVSLDAVGGVTLDEVVVVVAVVPPSDVKLCERVCVVVAVVGGVIVVFVRCGRRQLTRRHFLLLPPFSL